MMIKTQAMINQFSISNSNRNLSTYASSHMQLSADIDFVYVELNDNFELQVSRDRLAIIQEKVYNGYYVLNPIRIKFIHRLFSLSFLSDTLPLYPDIMICRFNLSCNAFSSNQEDLLILMGLSIMLLRLSYGSLPLDTDWRIGGSDTFYNSIKEMGKVNRLYLLDLRK